MMLSNEQLKEILVKPGHVAEAVFNEIAVFAAETGVPLTETLVQKGLLSDAQIGRLCAEFLDVPYVQLATTPLNQAFFKVLPESFARSRRIIAFDGGERQVKVAMADPTDTEQINFLTKKFALPVVAYYATERDIASVLTFYRPAITESFKTLIAEHQQLKKGQDVEVSIIKIVDLIFAQAYAAHASDIHIEPRSKDSLVRFRIDGILHDILMMPKQFHMPVVTRIKVLSKLRTDEHLAAQDGKLRTTVDGEEVDVRVSIVPVVLGEKMVLRLLTAHTRQMFLEDLGFGTKDLEKIRRAIDQPHGMILSTGPTGSGKTSTIYALLSILNKRETNIASIEDPVEYDIEGTNQIQVNPKTNLTFADGLRSILRQDPDIIFVGEIRDNETAGIAVNSALTGHLVLSTLHTNNAATALPRLIDMQVEPFLIASTVTIIIAQRLVRKICERCRQSDTVSYEKLARIISPVLVKKYFGNKKEFHVYRGGGCALCHNTGYLGRIGIFEVLPITDTIRDLITTKADAGTIQKQAIIEGMTTLLEEGLKKAALGLTTVEEILRAAEQREERRNHAT